MGAKRCWEEFRVGPKRAEDEMHVTLNRKGEIMIGARAYERFGRTELAVLLYDCDNKTIGVLPVEAELTNSYPLIGKKNSPDGHRTIRANRFCRHHGIRVPGVTAFNKPLIEDGMLVLDTRNARVIGRVKE